MQAKTFVLVHGAWHGGWCWSRVAKGLRAAGHDVFAPTLTGLADRSHLLSSAISLDTHISDVANLILWEDLHDVHLVLHSYGGWPGSGAIERVVDRIASVIYLDAYKPADGESGRSQASPYSKKAYEDAIARGEAGRAPPPAANFFVNSADQAWVDGKMTPQPNGVVEGKISLTGARERIPTKVYIRAPIYKHEAFDRALAECQADATWQTIVKEDVGHDIMIDQPEWLTKTLLEIAGA